MKKFAVLISMLLLLLISCEKPLMEYWTGFINPQGFPSPVYKLGNNPVTEAGFTLGRKLFYEPRFSRNNTISCGTCHIQSSAFTHHGHDVSHGIDDRLGSRNSPPIMNLAWMPAFFWDGGVFDLDLQPIVPITNHVEMDESVSNVLQKLRETPAYPGMFKAAFGDTAITSARTLKALSQFMLMCVSDASKYDSVSRKLGVQFNEQEASGYKIFQEKCSSCHKEPLFTDFSFRNNGIGIGYNDDQGRYLVTLNEKDKYRFKVPSLRNVEFTSPYMHDGRFISLRAVLDHYSESDQETPNLDSLLIRTDKPGIPLSETEKDDLLAFLRTLSDRKFLLNKQLSEQ